MSFRVLRVVRGLFWLLRKKSLGEIFNKNMAYGQKSIIGS